MAIKTQKTILDEVQFIPLENEDCFGSMGEYYTLPPNLGSGISWLYEPDNNLFNIQISDFYYNEDYIFDIEMPEGLSIGYCESVSGEELSPYKRLASNIVSARDIGSKQQYRAVLHKRIPIRCIEIELRPDYYENYLRANYPGDFHNLREIFHSFSDTSSFPEMVLLLNQIKEYKGGGDAGRLFYEAKVTEAVSLIVEFQKNRQKQRPSRISKVDQETINTVTMYISDHYADNLTLDCLTKIACVCSTKLKKNFKIINGCTITEYIQNCRITQAQHLLQYTELPINLVAQAVGYTNASRFTEVFKRYTGLIPKEYRR